MKLFDNSETHAKLLPKIVRSYALDAIEITERAGESTSSSDEARIILDQCGTARGQFFKAVGEGEDIRFTGSNIAGAALVADGQIIHLCGFTSG